MLKASQAADIYVFPLASTAKTNNFCGKLILRTLQYYYGGLAQEQTLIVIPGTVN
jgi:hypothetical protein